MIHTWVFLASVYTEVLADSGVDSIDITNTITFDEFAANLFAEIDRMCQ